jgi:putative hydrolase of HD superfamily
MHQQTAQELLALYSQVATLKLLPRTGWLQRGVAHPESVAEHIFGVTLLSLFIGDTVVGLDRAKLLTIALVHDLAEAYLTDLPTSAQRFLGSDVKHDAERRALDVLLANIPQRDYYLAAWEEYATGASPEARLVKAVDRLEMLTQASMYEQVGHRTLDEFWRNAEHGWPEEFPLLRALADDLIRRRNGSI